MLSIKPNTNTTFKVEVDCVTARIYGLLTYLDCSEKQLTALDVSGCTALTGLHCSENQLTALDVSANTALSELYCSGNQLTALDVSGCTALTYLDCYTNQLTALDVSANTALTSLDCSENTKIIKINAYYGLDGSVADSIVSLMGNATADNGTLNIYGGDNTSMHTAATTRGWTVNTNL